MKIANIITIMLIGAVISLSCGENKQSQLKKLQQKQKALDEKINDLKKEADTSGSGTINKNAVKVGITEVKYQEFNHYVEIQGNLDGDKNITVYPQSMGVIESILVNPGDKVKKGQVLAKLDDAVLQKNLKDLRSNYEYAKEVYEKQKNLWDQKIGSEMQYLTAKNNKESLEYKIAALKQQIDMTRITSPIDGTVEESYFKIGQAVGGSTPVFRIVNFSNLKVVANVAETYATKISKGDRVVIYFTDLKKEYEGTVSFVGRYINNVNRTFQIEVLLDESFPDLKANMLAIVKINDYKVADAIVLPINVVLNDTKGNYVYTAARENRGFVAKRTDVTVGMIYNGLADISSGLSPGDTVITVGYQEMSNGKEIRF